jgi:hypothetical protein
VNTPTASTTAATSTRVTDVPTVQDILSVAAQYTSLGDEHDMHLLPGQQPQPHALPMQPQQPQPQQQPQQQQQQQDEHLDPIMVGMNFPYLAMSQNGVTADIESAAVIHLPHSLPSLAVHTTIPATHGDENVIAKENDQLGQDSGHHGM